MLPDKAALMAEHKPDLLRGVTVVKGKAVALAYNAQGGVVKTEQNFTAIPYYAWANRGTGQMMVWFPNNEASAKPTPYPTIATTAKVTTSPSRKNPAMINDGEEPASSDDPTSYFDWWPKRGSTEWVECAFEKPASVSEAQVCWSHATRQAGVRVPGSCAVALSGGRAGE